MAHLSLYRKYRPQTFGEVVGQAHVTQTLRNALSEDRIAHAYLFSGPRGTGKTSTARILAKALDCEKGPTPDPCNTCTACIEITEGSSLDVVEIDAASHGSVDDARDLREKVAYAPVGGARKVYIIDECHMLSPAANNALLKVLEEPPPHVVFVFATTEPHKVLQTLLDRCQRYEFRPIDGDAIARHVADICEAEGMTVDEGALALIGARSGGSARDALTLLDQLQSFAGEKVTTDDITRLLGSVPDDLLFEVVDVVAERDAGAVLAFSDRLIRSGRDLREFVRALVDHLRSLFLVLHAPAAQEILEVSDERLGRLQRQANAFDNAELLRLLDLANEVQLSLRQAIEGRLALEVGLARMSRPDLHAVPQSMLSRIERLERVMGIEQDAEPAVPDAATAKKAPPSKPAAPPKKAPPRPPPRSGARERGTAETPAPLDASVPAGEVDLEKVQRAWELVLQKVKSRKISFQALLLQAKPVAWADGELVLEFSPRNNFHRDQVSDQAKQTPLIDAFFDVFGVRPRIRAVRGDEPEPASSELASSAGTIDADAEADGDSTPASSSGQRDPVELIKEGFEAEIVEEE